MRIKYLGTAAAEGFPALFCRCDACRRAALAGGKNIRLRSGILINDSVLIDITPDIYAQKLKYGIDLLKLEAIVVTHSHTDHFAGAELVKRSSPDYCAQGPEHPLIIYGNDRVCQVGKDSLDFEFHRREDTSIRFRPVHGFQSFTVQDIGFTAIPARHDSREECLVYLIRQNGSTMLYANDTGLLSEESLDFLNGISLDIVSLDCTYGPMPATAPTHMGLPENLLTVSALRKRGCMTDRTKIITTHFSHNCGAIHEELCSRFDHDGITVAYDGMETEI